MFRFRGVDMLNTSKGIFVGTLALIISTASLGQNSASNSSASSPSLNSKDGRRVTVVFPDGHRQSFALADVARIEFKDPAEIVFRDGHKTSLPLTEGARIEVGASAAGEAPLGRNHFVGKWKVGMGLGTGSHFLITLKPDGEATKSIGAHHGTWTVVDGEARISWDDKWHDAIRRVGGKHEKVAYEPGKTFGDEPSNVTDATHVEAEPI
jgi:hypothetical protein